MLWGCLSFVTNAATITIHDQNGTPLSDAVLMIKTESASQLDIDKKYIVDQIDKTFQPYVQVVPAGAYVEFPNSDDIRHHVYSFSKAKVFQLKLYAGKPERPEQFPNEGIVVLGCNIHDSMVGYIFVTGSRYTYKSDASGMITTPELSESVSSMTLWHPNATEGVEFLQSVDVGVLKQRDPVLVMEITEPKPRNTFEDVFRNK